MGLTKVPPLKNPRMISGGPVDTCAIDDTGVQCWGRMAKERALTRMPKLRNPRFISVGLYVCAIDDIGVHCWGAGDYHGRDMINSMPRLKHPRMVSVGWDHACALDDKGVQCWPANTNYDSSKPPPLKHPKSVSAGTESSCAIDDDGVKCWGRELGGQPQLKHPKTVYVGKYYACATDDNGLHCWGNEHEHKGATQVPRSLYSLEVQTLDFPGFNLDQIANVGSLLVKVSPPARTRYFALMNDVIHAELSSTEHSPSLSFARYLVVKLLSPAVLTNDSPYFRETLIPQFQKSVVDIERAIGASDLSGLPATALNRKIAVRSIYAAISVMSDFLAPEDRVILQPSLRALGQTIAEPESNDKLQSVFVSLDGAKAVIEKLESNPKSAFLVQTLQLAEEWLKGNH
jgi:hypothetical protein